MVGVTFSLTETAPSINCLLFCPASAWLAVYRCQIVSLVSSHTYVRLVVAYICQCKLDPCTKSCRQGRSACLHLRFSPRDPAARLGVSAQGASRVDQRWRSIPYGCPPHGRHACGAAKNGECTRFSRRSSVKKMGAKELSLAVIYFLVAVAAISVQRFRSSSERRALHLSLI